MANLFNDNFGSTTPDKLFAGINHPVDIKSVTLLAGQGVLKRGAVLGIVTASNKAKLVDSSAADGSQTADCILTDDVDTTAGDVVTTAYISGEFNRQALIFGGSDTADKHEIRLRELGIFLKDVVEYNE
ncbi:head decoration protein [Paenibacillus cisolokensis]|uniref:head decoration protein n=1 Tax=Paenibacillus cisolokensis TaxID=1658519 RepID=UPI003D2D4123